MTEDQAQQIIDLLLSCRDYLSIIAAAVSMIFGSITWGFICYAKDSRYLW